ncbi:hypothetical protein R6Q59_021583 [Mikania micrantha]
MISPATYGRRESVAYPLAGVLFSGQVRLVFKALMADQVLEDSVAVKDNGRSSVAVKDKGEHTKAFLRALKYTDGSVLEQAKIYKLKNLGKMELLTSDTSGCTFMLGFDNLRNQRVAPIQWTVRNLNDRNRLLACILHICKDALGRLPKVVGIDIVELALWAKEHNSTDSKKQNLKDGSSGDLLSEGHTIVTVGNDLLSQAEEEEMEALLGTYVMGIGEAEIFSERLKRELHALEVANVHAILEREHLIDDISTRDEDYLVDTIAVHDIMGILDPVFANPNICKDEQITETLKKMRDLSEGAKKLGVTANVQRLFSLLETIKV